MLTIGNLEIHVAHSCNLACESCTHYSDQGHKGILSLAEAEAWFAEWSPRLQPGIFSLLGGEPTINPQLAEFIPLVRRFWPRTQIRIVTNGFLLPRHPELPKRMAEAGDVRLFLSVHHGSGAYAERVQPAIDLIEGWMRDYGIRASIYSSARWWRRTYHGAGAAMRPFEDGQPRMSWENCPARHCPQLFDGKIWKCGSIAYLGMQHAKYGLSDRWQPYLAYRPLEPGCSDEELAAFFAREEEACCAMCPASPEHFELPLPFPARKAAQPSG